jgi:hypothetical protein
MHANSAWTVLVVWFNWGGYLELRVAATTPHNRSQRGFHIYEMMVGGKHEARVLRALYSYSTLRVFLLLYGG